MWKFKRSGGFGRPRQKSSWQGSNARILKKYRYADFFKPRYCLSLHSGSAYAKSAAEPLHPAFCILGGVVVLGCSGHGNEADADSGMYLYGRSHFFSTTESVWISSGAPMGTTILPPVLNWAIRDSGIFMHAAVIMMPS